MPWTGEYDAGEPFTDTNGNGRWDGWAWTVRFSPPRETEGTQYWELTVRAETWHTVRHDDAPDYDEFNLEARHYYHRYGYNLLGDNRHAGPDFYAAVDPLTGLSYDNDLPVPRLKFKCDPGTRAGPLRKPKTGENSRYLYRPEPGDAGYEAKPFFAVGMAKPWDAQYSKPTFMSDAQWAAWNGKDQIGWQTHCDSMRRGGLNFDYVWFAPWAAHPANCE